jgi:hypothetical protein
MMDTGKRGASWTPSRVVPALNSQPSTFISQKVFDESA